jgi:hypothetical protein
VAAWLIWWLAILIATTVALLGCLVFLGWHGLILVRAASQAQEELRPIADDIGRLAGRAGDTASQLEPPARARRVRRRR